MACPTCDHTLETVDDRTRHCPRCGTLVVDGDRVYVPMLVVRCRIFEAFDSKWHRGYWQQLGIEESINTPENRT